MICFSGKLDAKYYLLNYHLIDELENDHNESLQVFIKGRDILSE
jgi:hypothetical protein